MSDDTGRDKRHETLRSWRESGRSPAEHPEVEALARVAGHDRWADRAWYRADAVAQLDEGEAVDLALWTIELLDDDGLADWLLAGAPPDVVADHEAAAMDLWDRRRRPWAAELAIVGDGYRCALSGRPGLLAVRLSAREDLDREPILIHPAELARVINGGVQLLDDTIDDLTAAEEVGVDDSSSETRERRLRLLGVLLRSRRTATWDDDEERTRQFFTGDR